MTSSASPQGSFDQHDATSSASSISAVKLEGSSSLALLALGLSAGVIVLFTVGVVVAARLSELAIGLAGYVTCSTAGIHGITRLDARRRGFDALREQQHQEYKLRLAELGTDESHRTLQPSRPKLATVHSLEEGNRHLR
jgi:hypothetical protein